MNLVKLNIQAALLSAALSANVIASDAALPIGNLVSENNVIVSTSAGSANVSGDYAYMAGDTVTTKAGAVAVLSLDGGTVYMSPESKAKVEVVNGEYLITIDLGTVGFNFEADTAFTISSPDQVVTAQRGAASGAVAVDANGETVVQALSATLNVVSSQGLQHVVVAGEHWSESGEAQVVLAQDVDEDDDGSAWWMWALGVAAVVAITDDDDEDTGVRTDANGNLVDANGNRVDANGNLVDANGNRVDAEGFLVDASGNRILGPDGQPLRGAGFAGSPANTAGQSGLDCRDFGTCPGGVTNPPAGPTASRSS